MSVRIAGRQVRKKNVILKCTCNHQWQDEKYGKHRRVMNELKEGGTYRCSVCKKERGSSGSEVGLRFKKK